MTPLEVAAKLDELRAKTKHEPTREVLEICAKALVDHCAEEAAMLAGLDAKTDAVAAEWEALRTVLMFDAGTPTEQILQAARYAIEAAYPADGKTPTEPLTAPA